MSGISEPDAVTDENVVPLSNDRILFAMSFVVIFGAILGFVLHSFYFGLGFLVGGILSFINYYWLKASLKNLFETAKQGNSPRFSVAGYFWRYLTIGALLMLVFLTKIFPIAAFALGLASFAFAVMIEAVLRVFLNVFKLKEIS